MPMNPLDRAAKPMQRCLVQKIASRTLCVGKPTLTSNFLPSPHATLPNTDDDRCHRDQPGYACGSCRVRSGNDGRRRYISNTGIRKGAADLCAKNLPASLKRACRAAPTAVQTAARESGDLIKKLRETCGDKCNEERNQSPLPSKFNLHNVTSLIDLVQFSFISAYFCA